MINALISHPEIVKQFIPMGGVLYVSDLFCNSSDPSVRKESAALLAKAISDRLSGPRVKITVSYHFRCQRNELFHLDGETLASCIRRLDG